MIHIYELNKYYKVDFTNHGHMTGVAICKCDFLYDQFNTTKRYSMTPTKILKPSTPFEFQLRKGYSIKLWDEDLPGTKITKLDQEKYPEYFL